MGHYEYGGSNAIGVAARGKWAAVWTVDSPYIEVLVRDFFDLHGAEIREAASRGELLPVGGRGKPSTVDVINTPGDLDDSGWPKGYDSPSEYVAHELEQWVRRRGCDYEQAVADGYGS